MPVSITIVSLIIMELANSSSAHRVPHRLSRMQESSEGYSACRWNVIRFRTPLGCSRRFASHELRTSDIVPWTRRPCLLLPIARTRRNAMQNFVRVQIMSYSSGSGSTTLQKVDERRGKTLPRPMNVKSNPATVSKRQESHPSCNICNMEV